MPDFSKNKVKKKCKFIKIPMFDLRWYGKPPYCNFFPIDANNKTKYNYFINIFFPKIDT